MDPHLFGRIPSEIRAMIFDNLWTDGNYQSLANCYSSGDPHLRSHLEDEKAIFMFPIMVSNLSGYLSTNCLLSLRQVCSPWKSSIDNHLSSTISWKNLPPSTTHLRNVHNSAEDNENEDFFGAGGLPGPKFRFPEQINNFLVQFSDIPSNQNPIPTRTVFLIDNYNDYDGPSRRAKAQLYLNFSTLLEKFGHHIWKMVYTCKFGTIQTTREIFNILRYAPILKSLSVKKFFWNSALDEHDEYQHMTLPPLPQLKSLNIVSERNWLVNKILLEYGKQLVSLKFEMESENISFFRDPLNPQKNLDNLKALTIFGRSTSCRILDPLLKFNLPNLQRLSLDYDEWMKSSLKKFTTVFKLTNRVRLSLEELKLPFLLLRFSEEEMIRCYHEKNLGDSLDKVKWLGVPWNYTSKSILFPLIMQKFKNVEHLHFMNYGMVEKDMDRERLIIEQNLKQLWDGNLGLQKLSQITVEKRKTLEIIYKKYREHVEV